MKIFKAFVLLLYLIAALTIGSNAQNPLIRNMYSADPSARVFGDSVYVYPSHDILATASKGRAGWFCMEDYHVFASKNLTDWKDDGIVVSQTTVLWVKPNGYSMWAPDCIERNGKYYFYFPTVPKDTSAGKGFRIGVAVADKPSGPFIPQPNFIDSVHGIDPNVFIDDDGQAYLYWALGNIFGAKLQNNMMQLDGEVKTLGLLPDKGLKEGPYLFKRNSIYYLTYPHVADKTEQLEYAISSSPLGPFKVTGVIMDESPNCWTNHQSILQYKNQWYLFYHSNDYSPNFDKARSIRADSLFFNADGTIRKVIPTLRGIGITDATSQIQIDRYSAKSDDGITIDFIDTINRFKGWKIIFTQPNAWVKYNTVDFEQKKLNNVVVNAASSKGGVLNVFLDNINSKPIGTITIPPSTTFKEFKVPLLIYSPGVHHIIVSLKTNSIIEVDWLSFE